MCDFEQVLVAVSVVEENMSLIRAVDWRQTCDTKNEDMRLDLDLTAVRLDLLETWLPKDLPWDFNFKNISSLKF